jgi:hypothetical protein
LWSVQGLEVFHCKLRSTLNPFISAGAALDLDIKHHPVSGPRNQLIKCRDFDKAELRQPLMDDRKSYFLSSGDSDCGDLDLGAPSFGRKIGVG